MPALINKQSCGTIKVQNKEISDKGNESYEEYVKL